MTLSVGPDTSCPDASSNTALTQRGLALLFAPVTLCAASDALTFRPLPRRGRVVVLPWTGILVAGQLLLLLIGEFPIQRVASMYCTHSSVRSANNSSSWQLNPMS